jgi:ribose transport system substrate-binding protein
MPGNAGSSKSFAQSRCNIFRPGYNRDVNRTFWAVVAAAALFSSCNRGEKSKTLDITLVTKALDSEWWQRVKTGADESAAASPGVRLAVLAPEREVNIDQQVSILEDQITKHVSALAVAPAGVSEIMPVLEKAKAAGIPVVIMDTDIDWPGKVAYVGADNKRAGKLAGDYIVKLLDGKGKVAVIRGILGVATHEDRLAGFKDAAAAAPGIALVAVQPANSERALGMTVMENLLTTHPDLRAVFATNDQMALGAVEAIAARNLTGKVVVVGVDATNEGVRAIQAGRLAGDVALHPEALGGKAVEAAVRAAKGEPVEKNIATGETLVTKENAAAFAK